MSSRVGIAKLASVASRPRGLRGWGFLLLGAVLMPLAGCEEHAPPPPSPPVKERQACGGGYSDDPAQERLRRGIDAFRERRYEDAQRHFEKMVDEFPSSATVLVWLGDAVLFDRDREPEDAAVDARKIYARARTLHEAGCSLPRHPHYYLLMGEAYASIRLAKKEPPVPGAAGSAQASLDAARASYPGSAEIPYTQARLACLQLQAGAPVDPCLEGLRATLELAGQLSRPRFLRTHRSVQDWIVRARRQSEFGPLRKDPRFEQEIAAALLRSREPMSFKKKGPGSERDKQ